MARPIVILSDLHLGRRRGAARCAEALRPLWDGADHLIINGDVAEVHHPKHWTVAARQTLRLFDLCESDGVDLTLLSGNHDPFITDLRHLHLAGGAVFVTHGDVLHPAVSPWSPAAGRMRAANEAALAALEPEQRGDLEARLSATQHAAYAEWHDIQRLAEEARHSTITGMLIRPWALLKVIAYWNAFPPLAAEFAAEHAPAARFVVLGHTHRAGVWEFDDRIIINTGSFGFPGTPRAVLVEDGTLSVWGIRHRRGAYRRDERPHRVFTLPAISEAPPALPRAARDEIAQRLFTASG
ncbi:MAG: metallophosphoesterase family protein [Planctomycetota bacterium]|nr:metallophosphoesterase family protein [Planctomycetota bacterium]